VWERGRRLSAPDRAQALLATADPETPPAMLAELGIGERDRRLMLLREWAFGDEVGGLAECPHCGGELEFDFRLDDVRTAPGGDWAARHSILVDGLEVTFRCAVVGDLSALAALADREAARRRLLERCVLRVTRDGQEMPIAEVPEQVLKIVSGEMALLDEQADVELALCCVTCGHHWTTTFDIVSFFWAEVHGWAARLLQEVHQLASAYGWRERDILSLSPWRRQAYLEMLER
jgi:hypothetical protein